jgi:hypothetical protein
MATTKKPKPEGSARLKRKAEPTTRGAAKTDKSPEFIRPDEYEAETIRWALKGNHHAGREALELCCTGLLHQALSPELAFYLAERIQAFLDGEPLARALCVEVERGRGRPKTPSPEWKTQLAAFDILLARQGIPVEKRNDQMADARAQSWKTSKALDRSEAAKIRKRYAVMAELDDDLLLTLAGQALREILRN